ncbi:hypothetical protein [Rubrobacter indicoceani]|uniref:hypothetical protein n=1 Tax=Rubrobacter indicoceani TaxID=2051957 RepID=UPI000E5A5BBA|nr:hypothetical protein [Rubrobacter indicoceani]
MVTMPRWMAVGLVVFCVLLNFFGFTFKLFEPVFLYDEVAHFVTPFVIVALICEALYRIGYHDSFFENPAQAAVTGAVVGFVGAVLWEVVEVMLAAMGFEISNALPDSAFDVLLGVAGGALGGWYADRYLDNLLNRSRTQPNRSRVR